MSDSFSVDPGGSKNTGSTGSRTEFGASQPPGLGEDYVYGESSGNKGPNALIIAVVAVLVVTVLIIAGAVVIMMMGRDADPISLTTTTQPTQQSNPDSSPTSSPTSVPTTVEKVDMTVESCTTQEGIVTRECRVIIPPGATGGERLPVVVLLHGIATSGNQVRSAARMDQAQVERNFIVVAPEGLFASWNAGECCGIAQGSGVDDVGYLNGLIDRISQRDDVDANNITMVGSSNGGMMTWRYLCQNDGRIRAAAVQAATPVFTCDEEVPVPVLQVHGTADDAVPYEGGRTLAALLLGVDFMPLSDALAERANSRNCAGRSDSPADGQIVRSTWADCDNGTSIELVTVNGGNHDWPMGDTFSATDEVLDFLDL